MASAGLISCAATHTSYWQRSDESYVIQANLTSLASEEKLYQLIYRRGEMLCGDLEPILVGDSRPFVFRENDSELGTFNMVSRVVYCGQEAAEKARQANPVQRISEVNSLFEVDASCDGNMLDPDEFLWTPETVNALYQFADCEVFVGYSVNELGKVNLIDRPNFVADCELFTEALEEALAGANVETNRPLNYCVEGMSFRQHNGH